MFIGISCIMGQFILIIFTFAAYCRSSNLLEVKRNRSSSYYNQDDNSRTWFQKLKKFFSFSKNLSSIEIPKKVAQLFIHPSVLYAKFDGASQNRGFSSYGKKNHYSGNNCNQNLLPGMGNLNPNISSRRPYIPKFRVKPKSPFRVELNCSTVYLLIYLIIILIIECYIITVTILVTDHTETKSEHTADVKVSQVVYQMSKESTGHRDQVTTQNPHLVQHHDFIKNHLIFTVFDKSFLKLFVFIISFLNPIGQLLFICYQKNLQRSYFSVIVSTNFQIRSVIQRQKNIDSYGIHGRYFRDSRDDMTLLPNRIPENNLKNKKLIQTTEQQMERVLEFLKNMKIHNKMTILGLLLCSVSWFYYFATISLVDIKLIRLKEYLHSSSRFADKFENSEEWCHLYHLYDQKFKTNFTDQIRFSTFPEFPSKLNHFIKPSQWLFKSIDDSSLGTHNSSNISVYFYKEIKYTSNIKMKLSLMTCKLMSSNFTFTACVANIYWILFFIFVTALVRFGAVWRLTRFNQTSNGIDLLSTELLEDMERNRTEIGPIRRQKHQRFDSVFDDDDEKPIKKRRSQSQSSRQKFNSNHLISSENFRERRRSVAYFNKVKTDVDVCLRMCSKTCNRLSIYSIASISGLVLNSFYYFLSDTKFEANFTIAMLNFLMTCLALVLCHDDQYEMKKLIDHNLSIS